MAQLMMRSLWLAMVVATPVLAAPKPAPPVAAQATLPSVRAGVDLWRAGDWAGAVAIWQPFANAGDPDAMFNIGQAYKLGRALPLDKALARDWYRKAALKGHLPAQANLGILLFQAGEKAEAARWLKAAADRGEMRAQYVLGVAHWNGDGVARSLPLAYAYLARSSAQGLTEATGALNNLTRTISPVERANGWAIATSLGAGNGVPAAYVPAAAPMTVAELNRRNLEAVQRPLPAAAPPADAPPPVAPRPVVAPAIPVVVASAKSPAAAPPVVAQAVVERPPAPEVRKVELPPAIPPAKPVVIAEALPPAKPPEATKPSVPVKVETAKPVEKPKVAEKKVAETKPSEPPPGWRVQLGAFGKRAQAETAWAEVLAKQKAAVGKAKPIYEPGSSIIKLQMGPYKTRELAKDACAKLAFSGRACFVVAG